MGDRKLRELRGDADSTGPETTAESSECTLGFWNRRILQAACRKKISTTHLYSTIELYKLPWAFVSA